MKHALGIGDGAHIPVADHRDFLDRLDDLADAIAIDVS